MLLYLKQNFITIPGIGVHTGYAEYAAKYHLALLARALEHIRILNKYPRLQSNF